MSDGRSLGWCFTLNNPDGSDDFERLSKDAHYLIAGRETGDEGTPHFQGYCYFKTKKSLKQMKVYIPRAHWETQRGTFEQAIEYCKKDNDFLEFGTPPMSRKRQGEKGKEYWDEQLSLAKKGRIEECDSKLQLTHMSALLKVVSYYAPMPDDLDECSNLWYYGTTGTGKSYKARTENPGHYLKMCNKWWDGYKNEDVVIIEDFDKKHADHLGHHMKIWCDRYAFPAEIKGAKLNLRPKTIIVTSNYSPSEIWTDPQTLDPILRRFTIKHFN